MQFDSHSTGRLGRAGGIAVSGLVASALAHVLVLVMGWAVTRGPEQPATELVDIELAPPPPPVEALPAEVARTAEESLAARAAEAAAAASTVPALPGDEGGPADAGIDAPVDAALDAAIDAPPDARPDAQPDAALDAAEPDAPDDAADVALGGDAGADGEALPASVLPDGVIDAGVDGELDGGVDAIAPPDDAGQLVASTGSGSGSDSGSGAGSGGVATEAGSGSGVPGATTEPAVGGAPTTAGTAANLLAYFPKGHMISALIRFDRLRGTEWAKQTERLLQPLPDYRVLFGARDAKVSDTLDTLVISTPSPRDATATTLVARTRLGRAALRDFLDASAKITWSAAKGGLLGKREGKQFPNDKRVILSPFKGWFLLAQPGDLGGLTAAGTGDLDLVEAKGKLPAWVGGIRKIEAESGDKRGPSLVVTVGLASERFDLQGNDYGLGIAGFTTPERISLAMELVQQGWLIRGNIRFGTEAAAKEFVTAAETVQVRIANSKTHQAIIGKPAVRVLANLAFARSGLRVSYSTSVSIADARQILAVVAQQLDAAFARP